VTLVWLVGPSDPPGGLRFPTLVWLGVLVFLAFRSRGTQK
jgi:hypothetical protein